MDDVNEVLGRMIDAARLRYYDQHASPEQSEAAFRFAYEEVLKTLIKKRERVESRLPDEHQTKRG